MIEKRSPLLFRYPGGKHYAIDILRPFWTCVAHEEYLEPFAGGASVFFNKQPVRKAWLNDLDSELITTYEVVADSEMRKKLIQLFENEVANPERWREVLNFIPSNKLEIAFKYFYLNRTSFSGKLVSPGWGYRPQRSLPPERWVERILPCGEKLINTKLSSCDFEDVIKHKTKQNVLMYVDPPYYLPPKNKHYRHGLDREDHFRLCKLLEKTKHKFFLTYDDAEDVRELYKWGFIYPVKFFYRIENSATQNGARKQGFELVITNYEVPNLTHI